MIEKDNSDVLNSCEIVVIIPYYNDPIRLKKCLKCLENQSIKNSLFQIIVIDNGSEEHPLDIVSNYERVTLLKENKKGSYNARNKGICSVNAKYYAFTDSDCLPQPEWLESAHKALSASNIDAISGPIELFSQTTENPNAIEMIELAFAFPQEKYIYEMHYSPTANLIVKKSAIDKVGLFNGKLMSGGDAEWGKRLFKAKGKLEFNQDVKVLHPARNSINGYFTKIRRTTHGLWFQRDSNPEVQNLLSIKGILSLIIPPFSRSKYIFSYFPESRFIIKISASMWLYFSKLYRLYQIFLCRVDVIKSPERR